MGAGSASNKKKLTLAASIQPLEGKEVLVETRNDTVIRGRLEMCDEDMNLIVEDATCEHLPTRAKRKASKVSLRSRSVRYIHLPATYNPVRSLIQKVDAEKADKEKASRRRKLMSRKEMKLREQMANT